jgi:hypothetical protein
MKQETVEKLLSEIRTTVGDIQFWRAIAQMKKEKVNPMREKKVLFPWRTIVQAYNRQNGVCPLCRQDMVLKRGQIEGDHINPNLEDALNAPTNCQAVHAKCNRSKGGMSVADQAKHYGRTMKEIIDVQENTDTEQP